MKAANKFPQKYLIKAERYKASLKYSLSKINKSKYIFFLVTASIILISYLFGSTFAHISKSSDSKATLVHFINVGQGDAILINNNDFSILIDSGSNDYEDHLISYLKKHNITKLNYVIATHPHEDHIGAMDGIIQNFPIDTFISPKVTTNNADFLNLIQALKSKNLKINLVTDDTLLKLSHDTYLTFLWAGNLSSDNINNNSIVLKFTTSDISFLFTGDIEKEIESKLQFLSPELMPSTVLKVPHHGSSSSSTINFLNTVNPAISIITCGIGNDYGHPHKNTLKNLSDIYSSIYRTDIHGNIIIKTDGSKVWINSEHTN